ncbi:hypothetical protein [Paraburkholderia sp. JHI869]|uniref:hypothetical protein n=1 Tax=Paraburkholderia sp. JHI869 TaxID=3112959 RepID=UPI00317638E3
MQTCNSPQLATLAERLRAAQKACQDAHAAALAALAALVPDGLDDATPLYESQPARAHAIRGPPVKPLTTAELARALNITQGTIRRRLCDDGSYFGLVPVKLASGRLLWPADSLARLMIAGGASWVDAGSQAQLTRSGGAK